MGHYEFHEDLKEAQGIEERVIAHLLSIVPKMQFHGFSGTKGYDAHFTLNNMYYKLEIKSDYSAIDTGNIVIEYASRGKDSGIITTQANLWAYAVITEVGLDIYLVPTSVIRKWISSSLYERKIIGGDIGSNTKLYLFKLCKVAKYMKLLKEKHDI